VQERHRSPNPSPSQSPWPSSKWPRDKRLRIVVTINLNAVKHRVGLERPHFCTRFRAQSESWVAPAHYEISLVALPARLSRFCTKSVKEEGG